MQALTQLRVWNIRVLLDFDHGFRGCTIATTLANDLDLVISLALFLSRLFDKRLDCHRVVKDIERGLAAVTNSAIADEDMSNVARSCLTLSLNDLDEIKLVMILLEVRPVEIHGEILALVHDDFESLFARHFRINLRW